MNRENRNHIKTSETIQDSKMKTGLITERGELSYDERYEEMIRETIIDYEGERIPFKAFNPAYTSDNTLILNVAEIIKRSEP